MRRVVFVYAVLWALVGYSIAFGNAGDGGWFGSFDFIGSDNPEVHYHTWGDFRGRVVADR